MAPPPRLPVAPSSPEIRTNQEPEHQLLYQQLFDLDLLTNESEMTSFPFPGGFVDELDGYSTELELMERLLELERQTFANYSSTMEHGGLFPLTSWYVASKGM